MERLQPTRREEASSSFWEGRGHGSGGDRTGSRSRWTSTSSFHLDAVFMVSLRTPRRPAVQRGQDGRCGQEGAQVHGLGLSDGQRTPHTGPVLGVLQAAG